MRSIELPGLRTRTLGKDTFEVDEVDSTQNLLQKLVLEGSRPGTTLLAKSQLRGRGRYGHIWTPIPGDQIYASIFLSLNLGPKHSGILNFVAAAAIIDALDEHHLSKAKMKWPNDILVDGKKLGGVLSEVQSMKPSKVDILLGMGINLKGRTETLPESIRDIATTLDILNIATDRLEFFSSILNHFESRLEHFQANGPEEIQEFFSLHWAYHGQDIVILQPSGTLHGRASQIDETGALLLNTDDDRTLTIVAGDLRLASGNEIA